MKKALVTGSSGFIGTHLVRRLKSEGYFVVGVDLVPPKYEEPNVFFNYDLSNNQLCKKVFAEYQYDEVYNLACLMGGMGFIGDPAHSYDVMIGSTLVVANVIECSVMQNVQKSFYSSSACVYNESYQNQTNDVSLKESMAYPAAPDLVYGWQKLFSEQMYQASRLNVRIARFHNIYGTEGTYKGGKEKAPAAICRKVIDSRDEIEIWGDGEQTRSFLYIDDCIDAVRLLMKSDFKEPINIGSEEMVSINQLADLAIEFSGKQITKQYDLTKPQGVRGRNSNNDLIRKILNWEPKFTLRQGLENTYFWINKQINGAN